MREIELVIKISEEKYEELKRGLICIRGQRNGKTLLSELASAICDGTPLPEHHSDLIERSSLDVDNLDSAYDSNFELDLGRLYTIDVVNMIEKAPTIISATKEGE